jgi:hypothetical protein
VALRREVDHRIDLVLGKDSPHGVGVANIDLDKGVSRTVCFGESVKAGLVARVGEGIEVDQPQLRISGEGRAHEVASDEPGATGDQHRVRVVGDLAHGA